VKNPIIRITKTPQSSRGNEQKGVGDGLIWLIVIILAPLVLFFNLIGWPFKRVARARLDKAIRELWIPNQKYVYLDYADEDPGLKELITKRILPKYGKHVVTIDWKKPKKDRTYVPSARWMNSTIIQDYDDDYGLVVVGVRQGPEVSLAYTRYHGSYKTSEPEVENAIKEIVEEWRS
jgi:hypothetical protein